MASGRLPNAVMLSFSPFNMILAMALGYHGRTFPGE